MLFVLLFCATVFLAYTNGANDNFKGVATLFGCGTANYKRAIGWATVTTFAGSICAIYFAQQLVANFSGKELVPDSLSNSPYFLVSVGLGAGLTVLLATLTGFPISTTHGLTGALIGVGLISAGNAVNFAKLGESFVLPLIISPIIAVAFGAVCYFIFHSIRVACGITEETCVCIGATEPALIPVPVNQQTPSNLAKFSAVPSVDVPPSIGVSVDRVENCMKIYKGRVLGFTCQPVVDGAHYLSAGAVSFARGLNDTPKIVALMLIINGLNLAYGMIAVAAAMALGGLLNARKVSETMSKKITPMNSGQGFTANFVTAILVIFASKIGVPVSTTHVSVGSIFGMGLITKKANYKVVGQIALSWLLTLPIAAILGALVYVVITKLF
jgi:PiT family inorganic phosphate transporter